MKNPFAILDRKEKEYFDLIPQTGVTHLIAEGDPKHNAIWDMAVSPEGRVFFSVCGESYNALYARLYEYDKETKTLRRHFKLEDKLMTDPVALRVSKFHTAISFIGDHKILTTTHTTSPGPNQPTWMPFEYADHPYEGYPGSQLLIYDYETGETRGLGMLSPHDTTYGATYDAKNGDYFTTTWMRGTGYVYNVRTGEKRCLGQVSDVATSRCFVCSDGHIYGSTYSGLLFRYNVDKRDIEYLDVNIGGLMRHACEVDGVLYLTTGPCAVPGRGQELFAYHLKTGDFRSLGRPVPKIGYSGELKDVFYNAYGMAFDSVGRMWYGCMTFASKVKYAGVRLYMWDFLHGKDPVDCGFLGSEKRTVSISAEMRIVDDVLYVSDGNHTWHGDTPSGLVVIDLKKFVPALTDGTPRLASRDYVNYLPFPGSEEYYPLPDWDEKLEKYLEFNKNVVEYFRDFLEENAFRVKNLGTVGVSFWQLVGRENAAVRSVRWLDAGTLEILCGGEKSFRILASAETGEILECAPCARAEAAADPAALLPAGTELPAVPGRKFLAKAASTLAMPDGSVLVGTADTVLALVKDGKTKNLGRVCTAGPVRALGLLADGRAVGICGHDDGIGELFYWGEERRLESAGILPFVPAPNGRMVCICRPTALAVSPDGRTAAIGGADETAGVLVMKLL